MVLREEEVTSWPCRRGNLTVVQVEASVSKVGGQWGGWWMDWECGLWMVLPPL